MSAAKTAKADAGAPPRVSIILGTYNSSRYVEAALRSALAQTMSDLEIIPVDDCSKDNTFEIVQKIAAEDSRVKPVRLDKNAGPGGSRFQAVARATGEWIAVIDDDDISHPDRLERLLEVAEQGGFDVVADNLRYVREDGVTEIGPAVIPSGTEKVWTVGLAEYLRANFPGETGFKLGFLKPMIRHSILREHDINYQPHLRVVEDYQFLFEVLATGAKFGFLNECHYDYRIRTTSGSHNYSDAQLAQMAEVAQDNLNHPAVQADPELRAAAGERLRFALRNAAYVRLMGNLRKKKAGAAAATVARNAPYLPYMTWRALRVPLQGRVWSGGAKPLSPTELGMKQWESATGAEGARA